MTGTPRHNSREQEQGPVREEGYGEALMAFHAWLAAHPGIAENLDQTPARRTGNTGTGNEDTASPGWPLPVASSVPAAAAADSGVAPQPGEAGRQHTHTHRRY